MCNPHNTLFQATFFKFLQPDRDPTYSFWENIFASQFFPNFDLFRPNTFLGSQYSIFKLKGAATKQTNKHPNEQKQTNKQLHRLVYSLLTWVVTYMSIKNVFECPLGGLVVENSQER